jgi:hypothetical protein
MAIRQGQRPSDRRVRVERVAPRAFRVDVRRAIRRPPRQPALGLALGFLVLIGIGTVLLALPFATASGSWAPPLTALFTATSAVCVIGLLLIGKDDRLEALDA